MVASRNKIIPICGDIRNTPRGDVHAPPPSPVITPRRTACDTSFSLVPGHLIRAWKHRWAIKAKPNRNHIGINGVREPPGRSGSTSIRPS
jgi:hypothetical protein